MPELVAIAYEDETVANRAAEELDRCGGELLVDPDASSILVCERDGSCRLTTSRRADATSHWCEFWAALLDALLGDGGPVGLPSRFRHGLLALLPPGSSALLLVAPGDRRNRAVEALSHFGGRALSHRLARDLPGASSPRSGEVGPGPRA